MKKTHVYDDGGRKAAGYTGKVGDCTTRAIAIATRLPYRDVLEAQASHIRFTGDPNANAHVNCDRVLALVGWTYHKVTRVNGRWPHAVDAIPKRGRYIAKMHGHLAAVVDGVVRDEWDSTDRPVYGYWSAA